MSEIARDWEMLVFNCFIVVGHLVHSPFNRGNHWRLPTLILFVTLLRLCPFAHLYKCIDEQRAGRCSSVMHSSLLLARSKAATAAAGYPDTFQFWERQMKNLCKYYRYPNWMSPKYDKKKNEKRSNPLSGGDVTGRELLPVATKSDKD